MADSKISGLSAITALGGTEEFAVALAGASNKITAANIAKFMPGYEINYTQITSPVNITSTTQASGTTIISPGDITFDGSPVLCEFVAIVNADNNAVNDVLVVSLFEGSTQITQLLTYRAGITAANAIIPVHPVYRFTPSAGSHTYTITAFVTSTTGTPKVTAGPGGTGGNPPAFVRFLKV